MTISRSDRLQPVRKSRAEQESQTGAMKPATYLGQHCAAKPRCPQGCAGMTGTLKARTEVDSEHIPSRTANPADGIHDHASFERFYKASPRFFDCFRSRRNEHYRSGQARLVQNNDRQPRSTRPSAHTVHRPNISNNLRICYAADHDPRRVSRLLHAIQHGIVSHPSTDRRPPSARRGRDTTSNAPGAEGGTRERDEAEYKTQ
ncbi:hypothetical protein LXA43DRAFT_182109 [Ganoderma leucocontextum]|nr:hypothetical protein LXA43DRAFT_182109 [Ganoderma leucocontextum]